PYPISDRATQIVAEAHAFVEDIMGAGKRGRVALGPSTTTWVHILAGAYADTIKAGDEIVIADSNHESNIGPWARLESRGAKILFWQVEPDSGELRTESLQRLLSDRTRIVAFPHVSNLLGEVVDVEAVTRLVHEAG